MIFKRREAVSPIVAKTDVSSNLSSAKKALLVCCNPLGQSCLNCCQNKCIDRVYWLLVKCLGYNKSDIVTLCTSQEEKFQPTRANQLMYMKWLVSSALPGDRFVFYFNGPTTRYFDASDPLCAGMCFTTGIVPSDSKQSGAIGCTQLYTSLVQPLPAGCVLHSVIEADHSATMMGLPYVGNVDKKQKPGAHYKMKSWKPGKSRRKERGPLVLCLSSCAEDESVLWLAGVTPDGITPFRACTEAFVSAIEELTGPKGRSTATYAELLDIMHERLRSWAHQIAAGMMDSREARASWGRRPCKTWHGGSSNPTGWSAAPLQGSPSQHQPASRGMTFHGSVEQWAQRRPNVTSNSGSLASDAEAFFRTLSTPPRIAATQLSNTSGALLTRVDSTKFVSRPGSSTNPSPSCPSPTNMYGASGSSDSTVHDHMSEEEITTQETPRRGTSLYTVRNSLSGSQSLAAAASSRSPGMGPATQNWVGNQAGCVSYGRTSNPNLAAAPNRSGSLNLTPRSGNFQHEIAAAESQPCSPAAAWGAPGTLAEAAERQDGEIRSDLSTRGEVSSKVVHDSSRYVQSPFIDENLHCMPLVYLYDDARATRWRRKFANDDPLPWQIAKKNISLPHISSSLKLDLMQTLVVI